VKCLKCLLYGEHQGAKNTVFSPGFASYWPVLEEASVRKNIGRLVLLGVSFY